MTKLTSGYKASRHPIRYVREFLSSQANDIKCHYSLYSYKPHSFIDERQEYSIQYKALTDDWLDLLLSSMKSHQELGFHSKVVISDTIYHIPMIDLGGRSKEISNLSVIKEMADLWRTDFAIYTSGRSYHAYGNRLLTESEWLKFMGGLLLLNIPNGSKIIDTRWVGHRLLGGYSSLRWSNNTKQYKRYPTLIGWLDDLAKAPPGTKEA